ncbi:MAG: hypothetical protein EOO20_23115 [Chryseobacterium sp.]|nr:MAG: hypothetical protein EOO20_23115 [Chryseobacterium sp.]
MNRSTNGYSSGEIDLKYSAGRVVPNDGSIYLRIEGTGGSGWFEIYEKFWTEPPYDKKNEDFSDGVRIKSIKHYDRAPNFSQYYPHYNLKKTTDFDYSLFNEPGASSGMLVESMIYRNIKVTESDKPGYIRYYYKIPNDFSSHSVPSYPGYNFYPHWNYTKRGVLIKKEIYDINNVKNSLAEVDYTFPPYTNISSIVENVTPEKTIYTDTAFDSSGNSLTDTTERTFNQDNNNLMTEKKTSADGTVSETTYQYASEKGNTKLLGALMTSVPLEVTQKQNNIQIGKLETKYEQAGNYFPSSVKSFGINNVVTGEQSNDFYDSMGNVLQTTSK